MSMTIQQIITDAKRLANRLKERDSITDMLLNETQAVTHRIEATKQFQEEIDELNEVAKQTPHSELIANIQKENRSLRELHQENCALKATLEDYQNTLEVIMSKYRQHTTEQIYKSHINFGEMQTRHYVEIIDRQAEKIKEMAAIMAKAASIDDDDSIRNEELVTRLKIENEGLRQMLHIAQQNDSIATTQDKIIQTDICS